MAGVATQNNCGSRSVVKKPPYPDEGIHAFGLDPGLPFLPAAGCGLDPIGRIPPSPWKMSTWSRTPHAREVKTSAVFGHKTECGLVRSCQTFRDHQQREGGDDDWSKHCNRFGKQGQIGPDHWQAPRRGVKPYGRPAQGTVPVDWIGAGLNRASGGHLRPDEQLDLGPLMNRIRYSKECVLSSRGLSNLGRIGKVACQFCSLAVSLECIAAPCTQALFPCHQEKGGVTEF